MAYLAPVKTITLKISNAGCLWSKVAGLGWADTNLSAAEFRFREREEIFWEAEMTSYSTKTATLHLRVVDYFAEGDTFRPELKPKQAVREINFAPLDSEALKSQLSYYRQADLDPLLTSGNPAPQPNPAPAAPPPEMAASPSVARPAKFTFPLLNLRFGNGGVKGYADLPGLVLPVAFGIANDHLVAEFDAIKPFFVRALGRKTVEVTASLFFVNDEPRLSDATSPQIALINEEMLEVFRARSIRQLLGADRVKTVDKSLFTPDDVFASLDDDALGKATLPRDGHDLLAEILRHKHVRNARQLTFLAAKLHPPGRKLRFVLSPKFGFVFLAPGQDAHHFILELLDSHATYIWSIPRDWETIDAQYRAVEREIMAIGQLGRGQYRRTLHFEHAFWFVIHENAESGVVDGFPRWKNRLLEGLV